VPASAVPETSGSLSFAGDAGEAARPLGGAGTESSSYVKPVEHEDALPAGSVAVAWNVVVESFATVTAMPPAPKVAAEPLAAIALVQVALV
jgi:hypothetical protein